MALVYQTIKNSSTKRLVIIDTVEDLPDTSITSALYFVRDGRRLYIFNGAEWVPIITENEPPSWVNVPTNPTTVLLNDVYTLTLTYDDPELVKGTFAFSVASGSIGASNSVTLDSATDEFRVEANAATTFELTFTASDGANEIEQTVEFILRLEEFFELSEARLPNESFANSNLGVSCSVTEDYWAIGASGYGSPGSSAGIVVIYKKQNNQFTGEEEWVFDEAIQPTDISGGQLFGASISLYGDYLAVGASSHTAGRGKVYLWQNQNGTWTELDSVLGGASENLGTSVDITGTMVAAGAPGSNSNTGYVQLYNISQNTLSAYQTFSSFTGLSTGSKLGTSVSIESQYDVRINHKDPVLNFSVDQGRKTSAATWTPRKCAMKGNWGFISDPEETNGQVQVYKKDANGDWSLHSTLSSPESIAAGDFGYGLDTDGVRLIVGEPNNTTNVFNTTNYGKAYIYTFNETTDAWEVEQTLSPSNLTHRTAASVAIDGTTAVLGHPGPNDYNLNDTYANVFELIDGTWEEQGLLEDNVAGFCNGEWVAVEGDTIAISTHRDGSSSYTGGVWIYERDVDGVSWNRVFTFYSPASITAPPGANISKPPYGRTVSISGNRIVAGYDGSYSSKYSFEPSIVLFEKTGGTWSSQIIFFAESLGIASNRYDVIQDSTYKMGQAVSIDGDYVAIGMADIDASGRGAVAIYKIVRDDFFLYYDSIQTIGAGGSQFGWGVALDNGSLLGIGSGANQYDDVYDQFINFNTADVIDEDKFLLVAGAPLDNSSQGAGFIFENTQPETWGGNETITKVVGQYDGSGDEFGASVAAFDGFAAFGVPNSDVGNLNGGMVYVYNKNSSSVWVEHSVCLPSDAPANALFGNSISFSSTLYPGQVYHPTLVIGAVNTQGSGAVYIFRNDGDPDTFVQHRKVTDADASANDNFGRSVDIANRYIVAGAPGEESLSLLVNNVGKSKLYRLG